MLFSCLNLSEEAVQAFQCLRPVTSKVTGSVNQLFAKNWKSLWEVTCGHAKSSLNMWSPQYLCTALVEEESFNILMAVQHAVK